MTNSFTPGPWTADGWFVNAETRSIVTGVDCPSLDAENKANALLIATVPELLAALEDILSVYGRNIDWDTIAEIIAKAKGQS